MCSWFWLGNLKARTTLNFRRAWLTMFPSYPTSPRDPVECLQAGDSHARPEVTNL